MKRQRLSGPVAAFAALIVCLLAVGIAYKDTVRADSPELGIGALGWTADASLNEQRALLGLGTATGQVFAMGGQLPDQNPTALVSFRATGAALDKPWNAEELKLPSPLFLHSTASLASTIYVVGGWNGSTTVPTSYAATVGDGRIKGWLQAESMPQGRSALALALYPTGASTGYLYALGGWDGFRATDTVYRARVDGTHLRWEATNSTLPTNLYRSAAVVVSGSPQSYIYVLGGHNGSQRLQEVWRAELDTQGNIGPWTQWTYSLPNARDFHTAAIFRDHVVVVGGRDANGQSVKTVWSAQINMDGSLGPWLSDSLLQSLDQPLDRHAMTVVSVPNCGETLYIVGGRRGNEYLSSVYRSECVKPPTPTPFRTRTPTPTLTPSTPWFEWESKGPVALKPGSTKSVAFLYGSLPEDRQFTARFDPPSSAKFGNNTGELSDTLAHDENRYEMQIQADEAPLTGNRLRLLVQLSESLTLERDVFIAQPRLWLPLVLRNSDWPGWIVGSVWQDKDGDSLIDAAEGEGFGDTKVQMTKLVNGQCSSLAEDLIAEVSTDFDGGYLFSKRELSVCIKSATPREGCVLAAGGSNPVKLDSPGSGKTVDFQWQCPPIAK